MPDHMHPTRSAPVRATAATRALRCGLSVRSLVLALGCLAAACTASDFCLHATKTTLPSIDVTYVGKEFRVPAAGRCRRWSGFCRSGCSPDNVQSGTACTASDGSHVSFGITTAYSPSNRQWDWVRLNLPSLTGDGNMNNFQEGIGQTVYYSASGSSCAPATVP